MRGVASLRVIEYDILRRSMKNTQYSNEFVKINLIYLICCHFHLFKNTNLYSNFSVKLLINTPNNSKSFQTFNFTPNWSHAHRKSSPAVCSFRLEILIRFFHFAHKSRVLLPQINDLLVLGV